MKTLIAFSARHAPAVLAITLLLSIAGAYCLFHLPADALPDWSDRQVIVQAAFDRSPELVEQRVTRPLSLALESVPGVVDVRASSEYGMARLYATLSPSASMDAARTQILQTIAQLTPQLPAGVAPQLGPDANPTGWVYQYALIDRSGRHDLAELRDLQDWTLRPDLQKLPGVAEVAAVGGFTSQFQVTLDPHKLDDLSLSFDSVVMAIQQANTEVSGGNLDLGGQRFLVRSPGLLDSLDDLQNVVLASPYISMEARMEHTVNRPVLLGQIAQIQRVPATRDSVAEWNGSGEAVGGIVIARQGTNASAVIAAVKQRLADLQSSLPAGVQLIPVYDRSRLIDAALGGFTNDLVLTACLVAAIILLFLWDAASALVAILTIPVCLCLSGILLRLLHVDLNIATLTGLAISLGVLVDGVIIQVEHVHYMRRHTPGDTSVSNALEQVSPSVFLALAVIVLAFLPALAFTGPEGRIFRPLVLAKTAVMCMAGLAAVFFTPALRTVFARLPAAAGASLVWLARPYERLLRLLLIRPWLVIAGALLLIEFTVPAWLSLGSEFLPPFEEGSRLFMPTTAPGISVEAARDLIARQNAALRSIPEVQSVFAKAGHADTATDPAPLDMVETNIQLRPPAEWRQRPRWYTGRVPDFLADHLLRPLWPDRISPDELTSEMDAAVRLPGVANAWTSPISGRADMLSSGARAPFVLILSGGSPGELWQLAEAIRNAAASVAETRSAYADTPQNGFYLDVNFKRDKLAELGLPLARAQMQLFPALSGITATTVYENSIPRPVCVRYPRDFRDSIDAIGRLSIRDVNGDSIRVDSIASFEPRTAPMLIRSQSGVPAAYIYLDSAPHDTARYLRQIAQAIREQVVLPAGYTLQWSGRFADLQHLRSRLVWIVPVTGGLIAGLLWLGTGSLFYTLLICLAGPFSLLGSVWLMSLLHYKLSAASWIGLLALLGLDAETGIFMLLFLDLAWRNRNPLLDPREAVIEGAARRLRPKLMTVTAALCGLLPLFFSEAAGADFMRRLIAPLCGGLASSFVLELLVYPALFLVWQRRKLGRIRKPVEAATYPG